MAIYLVEEWDSRGDGDLTRQWCFDSKDEALAFHQQMKAHTDRVSISYYVVRRNLYTTAAQAMHDVVVGARHEEEI